MQCWGRKQLEAVLAAECFSAAFRGSPVLTHTSSINPVTAKYLQDMRQACREPRRRRRRRRRPLGLLRMLLASADVQHSEGACLRCWMGWMGAWAAKECWHGEVDP